MKISRFLLVMVLIMSLLMPTSIVLSEGAELEPITFTVFYPNGNRRIPPDDAIIVQQVKELTGVTIEWMVPPTDARERLNMMLATGEMPDVIFFSDQDTMKQFIEAGKLLPLDSLMKEYAPKTYEINYASFIDRLRTDDGDFYMLPSWYDFGDVKEIRPESETCFSSRTGLLKELGWPSTDTLDNVYELLKICKERYPEMSPMALALGPQGHLDDMNQVGAGAYGLTYNENMVLQNGELVYFDDVPEMKEWYAYLNKIYREGLMDIESPIMSSDRLKEKVVAGKVFSWFGPGWEIGSEFIAYQMLEGSDEVVHYYQMPKANESVDHSTYASYTSGIYTYGLALTTSCKNPERFMQFYELMNTEEGWLASHGVVNYDFTGENTFENTEGYDYVVLNDVPPIRGNRKLIVASQWMGEMWGSDENWWWNRGLESFGEFTFTETNHPNGQYDILGDGDVGMWWEPQRAEVYEAYGITGTTYWDYMREHSVDVSDIYGLVVGNESEAGIAAANMNEYIQTQLPKIIVAASEEEFEQQWGALKQGLEQYGKSVYVTAKNELYRERMAKWYHDAE